MEATTTMATVPMATNRSCFSTKLVIGGPVGLARLVLVAL